jgi:imidazolonepropionase-like amidohydrolase
MGPAGVLDPGVVLIRGERISAVGRDLPLPAGCEVVDARGMWVVPGLIDAHTHLGLAEEVHPVEGDDLNEVVEAVSPQLQALDGINFWDVGFADAVRGGVTRALVVPGSANVIGGQGALLRTWAPTAAAMPYRHPWGVKAALGENPKRIYGGRQKAPVTRMGSAALLRGALRQAACWRQARSRKKEDEFRHAALVRVLERQCPMWVHAHRADDIMTALRIADEFGIDIVIQHGTEAFLVADELARRRVKVALGPLLVNRAKVEMQAVSFSTAARLEQAGVEFCLVTDHPVVPVQYLNVCAALAVREGLQEEAALAAVTIRAAAVLGVDDELGSLEEGKRADLVVFDRHPLDVKARARHVVVDGRRWEG